MSSLETKTFTDAFNIARPLLNDAAGNDYTDSKLLPFGILVQGEIQDEFSKHGIPVLETVDPNLTYVAGAETIAIPTGDVSTFQAPIELWEQDPSTTGPWIPMTRVARIPPPFPTNLPYLGIWEWRDGTIVTMPCSMNRNIWCRWRIQLALPSDSTGPMVGEGFFWAVVWGTAYYAAQSTNRFPNSDRLQGAYRKRMLDVIQIASRDRQSISFRQQSARQYRSVGTGVLGPFKA